jgi:hypothetical protein
MRREPTSTHNSRKEKKTQLSHYKRMQLMEGNQKNVWYGRESRDKMKKRIYENRKEKNGVC